MLCHGFNGVQAVALPEIARHYAGGHVTPGSTIAASARAMERGKIAPAEYVKDIRRR